MRSKISAWLIAVFVTAAGAPAYAGSVDCKDGTTAVAGRGACSHHGGVVKHAARTRATKRTHEREQARTVTPRRHEEARPRTRETHRDDMWLEPREQRGDVWVHEGKLPGDRTHPIEKRESGTPTAVCNDGEVSYAINHRGACSGHNGVARWLD